jgi:hypothetical protein
MSPSKNDEPVVRRYNWRSAMAWALHSPRNTVFVVLLFSLAGIASVTGLLRWSAPLPRWSFAILCWLVASAVLLLALTKKPPNS